MTELQVQILPHGRGIQLPAFQTPGSAGADVRAAVDADVTVPPGTMFLVPTGLCIVVPPGHELQVRPRSGLAANHQVGLLNSPGTIDSDYRGEVKVILMNFGPEPFVIKRGDRIAQFVLNRCYQFIWSRVDEVPGTPRGSGGFGHTGNH